MHVSSALRSGDLSETVRWGRQAIQLNPHIPYVPNYILYAYRIMDFPQRQEGLPGIPADTAQPVRYALNTRGYAAAVVAGGGPSGASWQRSDFDTYVFALAAQREFTKLTTLVDLHPGPVADICTSHIESAPHFVVALQQTGRGADAISLMACLRKRINSVQLAGSRNPEGGIAAQLLALDDQPDKAVSAINAQIEHGWFDVSNRLADFPAFDSLKSRPDFAAAQARLDNLVARERREARGFVSAGRPAVPAS
jgi:hypothetical protein